MQKTQHKTKIIAHRGDTSRFPENTLESFEAARQNGADGIELDIHLTDDGVLVVHHDYYLGNPDNGHGTIPNNRFDTFTSASIKNTYHLPTLTEVFAKFGNTLHYEIELKAFTDEAIIKAIGLAQEFNLLDVIEFTSPHPYVLTKLKEAEPTLITGYFCTPRPGWMDQNLYNTISSANATLGKINVIHFLPEDVDEALITGVRLAGMKVHIANCDNKEDLIHAFTLGVDQISTNQLSTAIAVGKQVYHR
jgi:glycerophosphoryl diester phosphodiesterase